MKMSKWKFISLWCRFRGYWELAKMAKEIEDKLRELYGKTTTKDWEIDYKRNKRLYWNGTPDTILSIINRSAYCPACENSKNCHDCEFGNLYGACSNDDSLFAKFEDLFFFYFPETREYDDDD